MKKAASNKNVIAGEKVSNEGIYYASLFGAALITSIILLIISTQKIYRGLTIYSAILIPVFAIACIAAARYITVSKNTVYLCDGNLVIKSFFVTRSFKINDIKKMNVTYNEVVKRAHVKINYEAKNYEYKLNLTKEQTASLKRAVHGK